MKAIGKTAKTVDALERWASTLLPTEVFDIAVNSAREARARGLESLSSVFISHARYMMSLFTPTLRQEIRLIRIESLSAAWRGDIASAYRIIDDLESKITADPQPEYLAAILQLKGAILHLRTSYASAARSFEEAVEYARSSANLEELIEAQLSLALLCIEVERIDEAADLLKQIQANQNQLDLIDILVFDAAQAEVAGLQLNFDAAYRIFERTIRRARRRQYTLILARVFHSRGRLLLKQGRLSGAYSSLKTALRISDRHSFTRDGAAIRLALAAVLNERGEYRDALKLAESADRVAKDLADRFLRGYARATIGRSLLRQARLSEAQAAFSNAAIDLEEIGDWTALQGVCLDLIDIAVTSSNIDGLRQIDTLVTGSAAEVHGAELLEVYQSMAMAAVSHFDHIGMASEFFDKTLTLSERWESKDSTIGRIIHYGLLMDMCGSPRTAIKYLNRGIEIAGDFVDGPWPFQLMIHRGTVLLRKRNVEDVRMDFETAVSLAVEAEDRAMLVLAQGSLARLEMNVGRPETALRLINESALPLAAELANDHLRAELLFDSAAAYGMMQQWRDSAVQFEAARSLSVEIGNTELEANSLSGSAHVAISMGLDETAVEKLLTALEVRQYTDFGAKSVVDVVSLVETLARLGKSSSVQDELVRYERLVRNCADRHSIVTQLAEAGLNKIGGPLHGAGIELLACAFVLASRDNRHSLSQDSDSTVHNLHQFVFSELDRLRKGDREETWKTIRRSIAMQSRHAWRKLFRPRISNSKFGFPNASTSSALSAGTSVEDAE